MQEEYVLNLQCAGAAITNMGDRFVMEGYKPDIAIPATIDEKLEFFSRIGGMRAIGYGFFGHADVDPIWYKDKVAEYGFRVGSCGVDNYTKAHWKYGTFAARDPKIRKDIITQSKEMMDWAAAAGAVDIMFWMAHDGYNYPFQDHYETHWKYMEECITEIASYRSDVKVTLEYKNYEPLTHQYAADLGKVLLLIEKIGLKNLGIIVDYGHALFGNENPAESVAIANMYHRLSMIHLNDNFGRFDDDLIFGTVSFWQALEFFYKLNEIGYDGWYIMDNWPARMDGGEALKEFIQLVNCINRLARSLPRDEIRELQKQDANPPRIYKLLREYVLR